MPRSEWEHDGNLDAIADHLIECAEGWDPEARLLGNARAVDIKAAIQRLIDRADFYKRRCDLLQSVQSTMRDPERIMVCDILANCNLLPDPAGKRYGRPRDANSTSISHDT